MPDGLSYNTNGKAVWIGSLFRRVRLAHLLIPRPPWFVGLTAYRKKHGPGLSFNRSYRERGWIQGLSIDRRGVQCGEK